MHNCIRSFFILERRKKMMQLQPMKFTASTRRNTKSLAMFERPNKLFFSEDLTFHGLYRFECFLSAIPSAILTQIVSFNCKLVVTVENNNAFVTTNIIRILRIRQFIINQRLELNVFVAFVGHSPHDVDKPSAID